MHAITDVVAIVKEECGTTHQVTSGGQLTVDHDWLHDTRRNKAEF